MNSAVPSRIFRKEALAISEALSLPDLMKRASSLRDLGFGRTTTYSRKVFIPLTHLCRDSCHYCTFAQPPKRDQKGFMSPDEVLALARAGQSAGCAEALFTLGDKPELRYSRAKDELRELGYGTTIDYLKAMAALVLKETHLLPHLNPGVMSAEDMAKLRPVAASMGLMLEQSSERLARRGGVHFGSPDKLPAVRLATINAAGAMNVPMTSGLLIGIGETRSERIEALFALRDAHDLYGHIQEVIVQPFRAKLGTRMAASADASREELLWTIAMARLIFGAGMSIQTPPNLAPGLIDDAVAAGINDWGGISPVTSDFVNPEAPWPRIAELAEHMRGIGHVLVQRLPLYPAYARNVTQWADPALRTAIIRSSDSDGYARETAWTSGDPRPVAVAAVAPMATFRSPRLDAILAKATVGSALDEAEVARLFRVRADEFAAVCQAANELRAESCGGAVRYVVNRNINYTNVCSYHCAFCAFSKGRGADHLRGPAYDLDSEEIGRRVREAWERGATEVCMQGGIHPDYSGATYLAVLRAVKDAVPSMHVHAFSPLEVRHGASTLGIAVAAFLRRLCEEGLGSLPGTAAEILDDDVRAAICPDKLTSYEWLDIIEKAHRAGLKTTATIMFGHVDRPEHWARHLLAIRHLQERTSGFTEFVPLPFVPMEAPIYFKGHARRGPTWREAVLMHAVGRLALHPVIPNIQVSWVKMGVAGVKACLTAGANDLGGTLMNESISRAAGARHGEEFSPEAMDELIGSLGRTPQQRTTLYGTPHKARVEASYAAPALSPVVQIPARRYTRWPGKHLGGAANR
jgi:FO synthase